MRTRSDRGQATVMTPCLPGGAARDGGTGARRRVVVPRRPRRPVDRRTLPPPAGAQSLPCQPGQRVHSSQSSTADKNGGGVNGSGITISNSSLGVNDTITVHLTRPAPGVFTKLFGVNSVTVGAHASARASLMQQAQYIAPDRRQPQAPGS